MNHVAVFYYSGVMLVYYASMFYITIDKLMEVLLNIRYTALWNTQRAKTLVIATWILGAVISILITILNETVTLDLVLVFTVYVYPVVDMAFILTVIPVSYTHLTLPTICSV